MTKTPWAKRQRISQTVGANNYRARKRGIPGHLETAAWIALCEKHAWACVRCGKGAEYICIDHIKPLGKGGTNTIDNVQPLCRSCNLGKGSAYSPLKPD